VVEPVTSLNLEVVMSLMSLSLEKHLKYFFEEDDLGRNLLYFHNLPQSEVTCLLKFKNDGVIAGLPIFEEVFKYLDSKVTIGDLKKCEGQPVHNGEIFEFKMPFHVALTAERVALNLLQRACSIATLTSRFANLAKEANIAILDTRKTMPGLRFLDKYAVTVGGGYNHRFGQNDMFMVKDNHKEYFKGLAGAYQFFKNLNSHYAPIICEIHSIAELKEAFKLGIKNIMLDNFSPEMIRQAIELKPLDCHYEISGGVKLDNISQYLIAGVDAISIGALTHSCPPFDISMKMES
jgi:nicotinate-nucleotide pyrophosphorylase (carboxylating)